MKLNQISQLLLLLSVAHVLHGCSRASIPSPADLPIVYKIDVQQGNLVTQDMVAQLEPGMDKAKVKYVMGTPLVVDVFHQDRWDYIYTMQERGGERVQRRVSLYFKDGKLDHVAGDVKPARGAIATSAESGSKTVDVPEQEQGFVSRMKGKVGGDEKTNVTESPATQPQPDTAADKGAADATASATAESSSGATAAVSADTSPENSRPGGSEFVIDNSAEQAPDAIAATPAEEKSANGETPAASVDAESAADGPQNAGLLPQFQSESSLEDAVLRSPPADTAAVDVEAVASEAATGADSSTTTTSAAVDPAGASATGGTGKEAEVSIPDDAPPPPKKGFFRRMLEKVGVGDNEGGEFESADPKYKDPSNPDAQ